MDLQETERAIKELQKQVASLQEVAGQSTPINKFSSEDVKDGVREVITETIMNTIWDNFFYVSTLNGMAVQAPSSAEYFDASGREATTNRNDYLSTSRPGKFRCNFYTQITSDVYTPTRGTWDNSVTNYNAGDTVERSGVFYTCILSHNASTTPNDTPGTGSNWTTYWSIFTFVPPTWTGYIATYGTATIDTGITSINQLEMEYIGLKIVNGELYLASKYRKSDTDLTTYTYEKKIEKEISDETNILEIEYFPGDRADFFLNEVYIGTVSKYLPTNSKALTFFPVMVSIDQGNKITLETYEFIQKKR